LHEHKLSVQYKPEDIEHCELEVHDSPSES
jgi:hypothetical protein